MPKIKLVTEDDGRSWDALCQTRDNNKKELQQIESAMRVIAGRTFTSILSKGKWEVSTTSDEYCNTLKPLDRSSEAVMVELASTIFNLGYHDEFYITSGGVTLMARVNDNRLTIEFHASGRSSKTDIENDCDTLKLDVDLSKLLNAKVAEALQEAYDNYNKAAQVVAQMEAALGIPTTPQQ